MTDKNRTITLLIIVFLLFLLALPSRALADVPLPTIFILWPGFVILYLPIVGIEAWVARRKLGLSYKRAILISLVANFTSTLAGLPVAYLVGVLTTAATALVLESILPSLAENLHWWILSPALLPPGEFIRGIKYFDFILSFGLLILCIPLFFVSVWIEEKIARCFLLPSHNKADIHKCILEANLWSYALIGGILIMLPFSL